MPQSMPFGLIDFVGIGIKKNNLEVPIFFLNFVLHQKHTNTRNKKMWHLEMFDEDYICTVDEKKTNNEINGVR